MERYVKFLFSYTHEQQNGRMICKGGNYATMCHICLSADKLLE